MRIFTIALLLLLSVPGIASADTCTDQGTKDYCNITSGCRWTDAGGCSLCNDGTYKAGIGLECSPCPDEYSHTTPDGKSCYKDCTDITIDGGTKKPTATTVTYAKSCEYELVCDTGNTTCESYHPDDLLDKCLSNLKTAQTCDNGTSETGIGIYNSTTAKYDTYCTPGGCKNGYSFKQNTSGTVTCNREFGTCEPNQYTITYTPNGGTPSENYTQPVTYKGKYTTRPSNTYSRTGYTFAGWGPSKTTAGQEYTYDTVGDTELPAQWTAHTFKIKYESNGGNSATHSPTACTYDQDCTAPKNKFTKTGSTFTGWQCTGGGESCNGDIIAAEGSLKNATATDGATITLTAQWGTNTFNVKYSGGDGATGNAPTSPTVCSYGGDCTAPQNTYSKTGYTFAGWQCTGCDSVTAKTFETGDSISTATKTNDATITLTATWTANTYTVKFDSNKPTNASNVPYGSTSYKKCTYDEDCTLNYNGFKLTGWDFDGWNTKSNGSGTKYNDKASVKNLTATNNGTVTLYAQWTAKTYTVTYNCGDGANKTSDESAYTATATYDSTFTFANADICSHKTKNFGGWSGYYGTGSKTFNSGQKEQWTYDAYTPTTFTAQWSDRNYTCDNGKYLKADNETCTDCPAGYYCPGFSSTAFAGSDIGIKQCPLGMTSDANATGQTSCYISSATKFTDNNGASFSIEKLGVGSDTKYYYDSSNLPWHNKQFGN